MHRPGREIQNENMSHVALSKIGTILIGHGTEQRVPGFLQIAAEGSVKDRVLREHGAVDVETHTAAR